MHRCCGVTTPANFFRDSWNRQERYQKPSGKSFRDSYRQGWPVRDRLSGIVNLPWWKTVIESSLTVTTVRREFSCQLFYFRHEIVFPSVSCRQERLKTYPVSGITVRDDWNLPLQTSPIREESNLPSATILISIKLTELFKLFICRSFQFNYMHPHTSQHYMLHSTI